MVVTVHDICDQILKQVKQSNLNFVISETPFSLDIKIVSSFSETTCKPSDHPRTSTLSLPKEDMSSNLTSTTPKNYLSTRVPKNPTLLPME